MSKSCLFDHTTVRQKLLLYDRMVLKIQNIYFWNQRHHISLHKKNQFQQNSGTTPHAIPLTGDKLNTTVIAHKERGAALKDTKKFRKRLEVLRQERDEQVSKLEVDIKK